MALPSLESKEPAHLQCFVVARPVKGPQYLHFLMYLVEASAFGCALFVSSRHRSDALHVSSNKHALAISDKSK